MVSWNRGTPSHHPFLDGISQYKPTILGDPPFFGNSQLRSGWQGNKPVPIGSMYGKYANIWGILMVNVTIYGIHGSYGVWLGISNWWLWNHILSIQNFHDSQAMYWESPDQWEIDWGLRQDFARTPKPSAFLSNIAYQAYQWIILGSPHFGTPPINPLHRSHQCSDVHLLIRDVHRKSVSFRFSSIPK